MPAAYLESGVEVVGKPAGWGAAQQAKYEETDYHQPSDELRPDWDFTGAVEDAQLLFYLGVKVAEGKNMPSWNPGDEFEGARKQALARRSTSLGPDHNRAVHRPHRNASTATRHAHGRRAGS